MDIKRDSNHIFWNITDITKFSFVDILRLNDIDQEKPRFTNGYGCDYEYNHFIPYYPLSYKTEYIKRYEEECNILIKELLHKTKIIKIHDPSIFEKVLTQLYEFIIGKVFNFKYKISMKTEKILIGCNEYTSEGLRLGHIYLDNCGCKYVPKDFHEYHSHNNYDDDIMYSEYPLKMTIFEIEY